MKYFTEGSDGISYLSDNFKEHFGNMEVGVETTPSQVLMYKLPRAMLDEDILKELEPEEVTLGFMLYAFKTLNKSLWYIFYIRDAENTLWAVNAYWDDHGWHVGANPVSHPYEWLVGDHVVSSRFARDTQFESLKPCDHLTLTEFISDLKALIQKHENNHD